MGQFEDKVNAELPKRLVMLTEAITGYAGDPNLAVDPTINNAPQGTHYIDNFTDEMYYKKDQSDPLSWELVGAGGGGGGAQDYFDSAAETDDAVVPGQAVYVKNSGHIALAQADALPQARVFGLALDTKAPTESCRYVKQGRMVLADWTPIIGSANLSPGVPYFLDATTPGALTALAPASGYVVKVGRAMSATELDVDVEPAVRL